MHLQLDDDAICTIEEFIRINTKDPDIEHISNDDAEMILMLKPGEVTYIETTKIKRLD